MARMNKRIRRQSFRGWLKWAPLVALVFGVLFFDCWMSTQRRLQDFELSRLRAATESAREELETCQARTAELATLDRLDELAVEMGLEVPEPGQIERIYYDPTRDELVPLAYPFSMARLEEELGASAVAPPRSAVAPIGPGMPEAVPAWE